MVVSTFQVCDAYRRNFGSSEFWHSTDIERHVLNRLLFVINNINGANTTASDVHFDK